MADKADAPRAPTEAELRELMLHGEQLRQQIGAIEQQRDLLADLAAEARRSLASIDALATAKDGDEVLVPLGAGAFVHARLAGAGRALASLGAGLHAEMPVEAARERLQARVESIDQAAGQLTRDLQRVVDEMQRVNAVVENAYGG